MKKRLTSCLLILCIALSGCAVNQREAQKMEPPGQEGARQEVQDGASAVPSQAEGPESPAEPDSTPEDEDDVFSGRWQAAESPQYYMDIAKGDGGSYTLEIVWAGASRGDIIWQVAGSYDETWGGVAYTGAKYEDVVKEDGAIDRTPIPEREEVTGMVYLEDDGTLHWIDDFDHAGDDMSFEKELSGD